MIAELERHVETTDFAAGLRAKDLEKSAAESQKLADRLRDKDFTLEEQKRVQPPLDKSLAAADEHDKQGLVGKHLQQAEEDLRREQSKPAGDKFERLASCWRRSSSGS